MNNWLTPALRISKTVAQAILLILTLFWIVFAVLSGAEEQGGGFKGLIKNIPNALPWLVLLAFNFLIYRFNLIGGIVIFLFSWFCFFAFNMYEQKSGAVFFLIFVPLLIISLIFIGNGIMNIRLKAMDAGDISK